MILINRYGIKIGSAFTHCQRYCSSARKTYREKRLLGYSKEQLYNIVSRVDDYHLFLPACTKSVVTHREPNLIKADLVIGFPPMIVEKYTSHVDLDRPNLVRARCFDGRLFKHLITEWKFSDGKPGNPRSCTLDFFIDFEFRNHFYSRVAHSIFDQLVHQTVNCFLKRAKDLYGKPSI
ncbi:coenzyme Q-binding protein COQ10 homolog B, mitochondrial [Tetranychus urticae]|uniref:Coenzyme Q-binding protein COQ10 START domain-containing protein n=1 Tax=Tetranychus urticae TaxID=32264 RepID=T1L137_TETUR|nr:coenzyme Q-binding protein COQ10 homolog B, mitochondrial [Tetranychus urticae]